MTKSQYRAARALIADPAHWTAEWFGITAEGKRVQGNDKTAIARCAYGACNAVIGDSVFWDTNTDELCQAGMDLYRQEPVQVNNNRGHAAVLAMFDRAIELAPDEEHT